MDTLTNTTTISNKVISSNAGFADAKLNLWDRLFGTAGIRQDEYNVFGSATTYRVTGGYLARDRHKVTWELRNGISGADHQSIVFPDFGNPDLKPEKSKGLDMALDQTLFNDRVILSVGYFWTRYQNLILSVFDPVGCDFTGHSGFCAQNIGLYRAEGSRRVRSSSSFVTSHGSKIWICSFSTRTRVQKT